jgi:multidrug resistance efflux pump
MNINYNRKRRDPAREGQMAVQYAPGKRVLTHLKWRLTLLIVLSPFIYFLGKILMSLFVAPSSGFVMLDIQQYQSPADCVVQEIKVEIGQKVEIGDLLVVLQDRKLDSDLSRLQMTLAQLSADPLQDMISGEYLTKQQQLALQAVKYQQERVDNVSFLFDQGAATIAEKKSALAQLDAALLRLNSAEYAFQQWLAGQQLGPEDLKKRPEYRDVYAKIEQLEQEKSLLSVRATYPGQITEINVTQGQVLQKGGAMVAIAHQDRQIIAAFVEPDHIDRVQRGEVVDIIFPSGETIKGRVQYNPSVTGRLPAYLSTPMLGRQRMIIVHVVPLMPLPPAESIDGLPVDVNFTSPAQQFFDRIKSIFASSDYDQGK